MLDELAASRWLTWHLTVHPVDNPIKIFAKDESTFWGMHGGER